MVAPALYLQIKQHILDGIRERHYQAGDRIPTEAALCEQFTVSRMTVNRALRELVAKVHRDAIMAATPDPGYGWAVNKGYGAAAHLAALADLGPCEFHRRSWKLTR